MYTVTEAPAAVERRAAERVNVYIRFDYLCRPAGAAPVKGAGVTINMSSRGALLMMSSAGISVGAPIELVFYWGEGGGDRLPAAEGAAHGTPCGERMVRTRAVVVRVQHLDGFPSSAAARCGVSVGFVRPSG